MASHYTKNVDVADDGALLEYEPHRQNRIFLRRLSGSDLHAASVLWTNGGEAAEATQNGATGKDRSKLVLRPLTVQQRIRELNLRARHFAETIMAVQLHDAVPSSSSSPFARGGHSGLSFSLQTSPTHTPRCLEPIDFTNLGSSRYNSTENLPGLSSRWRFSRRSLRSNPDISYSREELYDSIEAEGERLLDEREVELHKRLQSFEDGSAK